MGQTFSKCCCPPEEQDEQPAPTVLATATHSRVATTLPNEQNVHPSGVNPLPNQPSSVPIVSPGDPTLIPSGVTPDPNEAIPRTPEVAAHQNEPTPSSSQLTAPETAVIPFRERDFWKEAVGMLPKEYEVPEEWRNATSGREDVVRMVNTKMEECKDKQWEFEIKGKKIVAREAFGKTLEWVKKFAAVGDVVVSYDPGHAALPWAGFRFLLQFALNEKETCDAMLFGLERATWLASYCRDHELLFKQHVVHNSKHSHFDATFVKELVQLYTAILTFLIQAHKYYMRNTLTRVGIALIIPSDSVAELTKAIEAGKGRMEDYAGLISASKIQTRLTEDESEKFMGWISDVNYTQDHMTSRGRRDESGKWLETDDTFCSWKETHGLLWLRGISGAGKTRLTSTVIDHLKNENHTVAYFYCTRDTKYPKKEDPEEILRAIVKQLVVLPIQSSDPVRKKYEAKKQEVKDHEPTPSLTFQECENLIVEITNSRTVTIVIDALDECRESKYHSNGSRTDRHDLLELFKQKIGGNVKVFLSSRDDPDIRRRLEQGPTINLDVSKNGGDIERFVESEVDSLLRKNDHWQNKEQLRGTIIRAVNERADGMFRFAELQIGYLSSMLTESDVEEGLRGLPEEIGELYDKIYQRILVLGKRKPLIAKRALSWLLCARQKLSSSDLIAIVSPDPKKPSSSEEILAICRHFIVLNKSSDSFEFAHLSVREYLELHEEYKDHQPDAVVAKRCIELLEAEVQGSLGRYASLYWPGHYNNRPPKDATLTATVKNFFRKQGNNQAFVNWARLAEGSSQTLPWRDDLRLRLHDTGYKPLSVICVLGFPELLDQWLDSPPTSSYFQHPDMIVHLAIKWGNEEVVRLLLQGDAQPALDNFGANALIWAAVYERKPVLEVLKALYGNVDAKDEVGWTALHWAVLFGLEEGLKHLLSLEAGPNLTDQDEWTPLHWAAFLGRDAETRLLVKGGHKLDAKDGDALTPFRWAKFVGHPVIEKLLWTKESDDGSSPNVGSKFRRDRFRDFLSFRFRRDRDLLDRRLDSLRKDAIKLREKFQTEIRQAIAAERASNGAVLQE